MRRKRMMAAVFASIALVWHPYKATSQEHKATKQGNAAVILPAPNHQDGREPDQAKSHVNTANPNTTQNPNTPIQDPNWLLVIVGSVTCVVIGWQSYETRKSAEATRDGIRIQEAGVRQWVNVVPLGLDIRNKLADPSMAVLKFEVVNRTDFPLTVTGTDIEVIANIHAPETFATECSYFLVPQKADGDSAYPFFTEIAVALSDWSDWGRIFIVAGSIKFLDCMGIERTQTIQDLYRGFMDGRLERMKPAGITTAHCEDETDEHPSQDSN